MIFIFLSYSCPFQEKQSQSPGSHEASLNLATSQQVPQVNYLQHIITCNMMQKDPELSCSQ